MSSVKISVRFFDDREVRAIWDEKNAKWRFSVLDIVAVLTGQDDYNENNSRVKKRIALSNGLRLVMKA